MTWLAFILDAVAVYRLARLVTTDELSLRLRERIIEWAYLRAGFPIDAMVEDEAGRGSLQAMVVADMEQHSTATDSGNVPRLAELIVCRWCASIWLAAGVVAARWAIPVVWTPVAWGLAAASVGALLARLED